MKSQAVEDHITWIGTFISISILIFINTSCQLPYAPTVIHIMIAVLSAYVSFIITESLHRPSNIYLVTEESSSERKREEPESAASH